MGAGLAIISVYQNSGIKYSIRRGTRGIWCCFLYFYDEQTEKKSVFDVNINAIADGSK